MADTDPGSLDRLHDIAVLFAGWVVAAAALAAPTWQREPAPFAEDTAGLVIVLKVTKSMESQDVQPTRLARSTEKVRDLLALRPGAKTALIAYVGTVHRFMSLTSDADIVNSFAAELSPDVMPVEGSAAGAALVAADEVLRKSGQPGWVLWVADSATPDEVKALEQYRGDGRTPVTVLAVAGDGPELEPLKQGAAAVDAPLVRVTPDDADVRRLAANTRFSAASKQAGGDRRRDFGYWLVWPVTLLSLLWFRRGWRVRVTAGG